MSILQSIKMAAKSIGSNKGRSFLTMLGIIIGIAAVIILVSIVQAQQDAVMEQFEKMGTNQINVYYYQWGSGGTPDYTRELEQLCAELGPEKVIGITPQKYAWSNSIRYQSKHAEYPNIYLASDKYSVCSGFKLKGGRDLCYLDIQKMNRVCVLGSKVAADLFNYADPVGKKITISGDEYTVVGYYESKGVSEEYGGSYRDNIVVVPYTLEKRINKSSGGGSSSYEFIVKAASSDTVQEVSNRVKAFLEARVDTNNGYVDVYSNDQWQQSQTEGFAEQAVLLGSIAAISLLVGGIGIMNIMLVTVTERTREIGIRKAIGAPRRSIITQFLIEAAMVSTLGGIIGMVVGCLGTVVAGKLVLDTIIAPPPYILAVSFVVSVAFGVIFGVYPAGRASRLQPVEALRNE